jgi:hypothetical protein
MPDAYLKLMKKAAQHASANNAPTPVFSPIDFSVVRMKETKEDTTLVPIIQLHAVRIRVVPWTTNDPAFTRKIIESGADGLITDVRISFRLSSLKREAKHRQPIASGSSTSTSAHREGRRLRPENTFAILRERARSVEHA